MDKIKLWCRIVCVVVIFSGVLLTLVPEVRIKKSFRALVSIVVIFVFVSPLSDVKGIKSFISEIKGEEKYSEEELMLENSNIIIDCAEEILENRLNEILTSVHTDSYCKAYIKENEGEAYIEKIELYGDFSSDEKEAVADLMIGAVGGDIEIEFIR